MRDVTQHGARLACALVILAGCQGGGEAGQASAAKVLPPSTVAAAAPEPELPHEPSVADDPVYVPAPSTRRVRPAAPRLHLRYRHAKPR